MADAIGEADLGKMRGTQWQNLYLAIDVPPTIWSADVVGNPDQGAYNITFDGGALTDTAEPSHHYEVWFGSTEGGKERGVTRIRSGALPNWAVAGGTLRVAANDMDLADNDHITIKQNIRPTAILPSIDGVYEDEDKSYGTENTEQHPLARIGPPACGFISTAEPDLTVNFWSDDEDMGGSGLDTWAWTFAGGNPNSSAIAGTAAVPIPIEYDTAGRYWVRHLVTDNNGKTHKRYTQVHVFDKDNNPPIVYFSIEGLTGDRNNGSWRCTIKVNEACTEGAFPDLAQVVIFNEGYWNGSQDDVGYGWTHRENIMFVGYIVGDTVTKDPYDSSVTFVAVGVCELMKNITCWGASFKDASETWHHIPNMTLNLSAFHVFTEHTTLDHIADIYLNLDVITMKYTDLGEGAVFDQVKVQIGEAGRALLMSNSKGQIYLEPDAQLSLIADRPATELWTMNTEDWRERLDLGEEMDGVYKCCQVDFIGFYYDGNDPKVWGSLAPNRQWPTGSVQKVTGVRTEIQDDANDYAGVYEQNYNNPFDNVVVPMHGYYPVLDIAPQAYLRITLQAADTIRGLIWTTVRHIIKSVTHTWDPVGGYLLTDVALVQEIGSATGTTNLIPTEDPDPDPPDPDPMPEPEPDVDAGVVFYSSEHIALSTNFFEDDPTEWKNITAELATKRIYKVVVGNSQQAFATTDDGVWYCPNILAVTPAWSCIKTQADARTETSQATGQFRSLEITSGGTIYLIWHGNYGTAYGYWSGNAGGINYHQWADFGASKPCGSTSRSSWAAYPQAANLWFCARGGGVGGALIDKAGAWVQVDPVGGGGQSATHVNAGYAVDWNGWIWIANAYDTKWSETIGCAGRFGMDILDGSMLFVEYGGGTAHTDLHKDAVKIADSEAVFGATLNGACACRVLLIDDEIIWVCRDEVAEITGDKIIVWTDDLFVANVVDKTGDYFTEIVNPYAGATISSGGHGNAAAVVFEF